VQKRLNPIDMPFGIKIKGSGGPKEPCIRRGSRYPQEGAVLCCVCLTHKHCNTELCNNGWTLTVKFQKTAFPESHDKAISAPTHRHSWPLGRPHTAGISCINSNTHCLLALMTTKVHISSCFSPRDACESPMHSAVYGPPVSVHLYNAVLLLRYDFECLHGRSFVRYCGQRPTLFLTSALRPCSGPVHMPRDMTGIDWLCAMCLRDVLGRQVK